MPSHVTNESMSLAGAFLSRSAALLCTVLFLHLAIAGRATAEETSMAKDRGGQNGLIAFHIPSQTLSTALDAYSSRTGIEVLYDSGLANRRRSHGVEGDYRIEDGLSVLLLGSGLMARPISDGAITITQLPANEAFAPGPGPKESPYRVYFAAMQVSFEKILCRSSKVIPQSYRSVLKFGIGPLGQVEHPELLHSNGTPVQDLAVAGLFAHTTIGQAPPSALLQPIMLLILPKSPGDLSYCVPH
jgi:hypothetical protein